jgi:hypothetical protein
MESKRPRQSANQILGGIKMSSIRVADSIRISTTYESITMVDIEKLEMTEQPMPDIAGYARIYLEESIKTFGIKNPLRITHDYRIIDGRNRYAIAQELGITRIPCIISDVDKNPMDEALRYHLELGRRSLTKEQHKAIKKECEIFEEEIKKETFKSIQKRIIPGLRNNAKRIYETTGDLNFLIELSSSPPEVQEELIEEKMIVIDDKIAEDPAKEIERLNNIENELRRDIKALKRTLTKTNEQHKELTDVYETLKAGIQKEVAEKLDEKKKELEERYRAKTPSEIQQMLDEEKKRLEADYDKKLEEDRDKLMEMSETVEDKNTEIDELKFKLANLKEEQRSLELSNKKTIQDLTKTKVLLEGLTRPQKFVNRLQGTFYDLNNTYNGILQIGINTIDKDNKKLISQSLKQIDDVTGELMLMFGVERCQEEKKKSEKT